MQTDTFLVSSKPSEKGLPGSTLKLIAIITMFIDHIGAAILENSSFVSYVVSNHIIAYPVLGIIDIILRLIGRIAFPIFCFLLVEGFLHTHDVKKYALRLGVFCLISELPFDFAFSGSLFNMGYQNVFFTLFIGLLVLIGLQKFEGTGWKNGLLRLICVAFGAAAAILLKTDYSAFGVCTIILFYWFRNRPVLRDITTMLTLIIASLLEVTGLFALIPIHLYNGKRGMSMKYFFYLFYPVHLLLLCGIRELLIRVIL